MAEESSPDIVLNLIRRAQPYLFIHGVINGKHNAPFFVTRFQDALHHFSSLFDMLDTIIERMLIEKVMLGREALNTIASEGWERVERPESYKQWQLRNMRAGFVQVPLSRRLAQFVFNKIASRYHKDFNVDKVGKWLLLGWKGRFLYAFSTWKPA
ncbi:scarecrow-like protein 9 [Eucalyptus grandis]|uniref:scarecrow-like protein 9 n=1 Tax=Eucalyptus grandis TaxID=71139 RepID=UPI00052552FA|nr:scarecrow-like protein 9 [Eucalyptus grandis]